MLRHSVSLLLATVLGVAPIVHAGSTSGIEGSRSGSPGSQSSEGNDEYASSQSGGGGSSASSSHRGASGSGSGSFTVIRNNTQTNRFDRAALELIQQPDPVMTPQITGQEKVRVFVMPINVETKAEYDHSMFRMWKLVGFFVYQKKEALLQHNFEEIPYNDPLHRGYDLVIAYVDSPELEGPATSELKKKVAAHYKAKVPVVKVDSMDRH